MVQVALGESFFHWPVASFRAERRVAPYGKSMRSVTISCNMVDILVYNLSLIGKSYAGTFKQSGKFDVPMRYTCEIQMRYTCEIQTQATIGSHSYRKENSRDQKCFTKTF